MATSTATSTRLVAWHSCDYDLFVTYDNLTSRLELCRHSFDKILKIYTKELNATSGHLTCLEWNPTITYFENSIYNNSYSYNNNSFNLNSNSKSNNRSDILAYGTTAGAVNIINFKNISHSYDNTFEDNNNNNNNIADDEISICNPIKFGKRNCNAVSWNRRNTSQLAAGFENTKSDYCALVWDVEKHGRMTLSADDSNNNNNNNNNTGMSSFTTDSLLCRLSQGESCSSLCWLQENPFLLAVGTSMGWLRLYDIRNNNNNNNNAVFSIMAHPAARPRKVKGIRADPFNQSVIATFSDVSGDVVKLWDLRKVVCGVSSPSVSSTPPPAAINHQVFTIVPRVTTTTTTTAVTTTTATADNTSSQQVVQPGVTDISWCPYRPGVLAVAISGQRYVNIYNVNNSVNKSTSMTASLVSNESLSSLNSSSTNNNTNNATTISPLLTINTPETIKTLSWQGTQMRHYLTSKGISKDSEDSLNELISNLVKNLKKMNIQDSQSTINSLMNCPFNRLLISYSSYSPAATHDSTTRGYSIVKVRERVPLAFSSSSAIVTTVPERIVSASLSDNKKSILQNDIVAVAMGADGIFNEFLNNNKTVFSVSDLNNKTMIMKSRSKSGYSIDANENVEVLACELDVIFSCIHGENKDANNFSNQYALLEEYAAGVLIVYRVWLWIDRFETNVNENNLSLLNCGIFEIMNPVTLKNESMKSNSDALQITVLHPLLGTNIYVSKSRNLCKKLCGWISITTISNSEESKTNPVLDIDNDLLEVIVEESENLDSFERAVAIALWHGNIELSVKILRNAITKFGSILDPLANIVQDEDINSVKSDKYNYSHEKVEWDENITEDYVQLVSLVGMCFAGYHSTSLNEITSGSKGQKVKANSMWASMCKHLILKLSNSKRKASAYLQASCTFLLININEYDGIDNEKSTYNGYTAIINNESIILEDRIAFASTYVANAPFVEWLNKVQEKCKRTGQLDGIIITGLSKDGLDIIQNFIDQYDDIQTSALLVSRIIDHNNSFIDSSTSTIGGIKNPSKFWIWLYDYRNLLNKWEQFIERASLDVELGKRYRKKSSVSSSNSANNLKSNSNIIPPKAKQPLFLKSNPQLTNHSAQQNTQQIQERMKRVMYTIPPHSDVPHVFLRCSYCGATLPVDGMLTNKAESLRSQKNVLNCCANCNKQLPRCYVCQLYMGMINPYLELTRTMTQKRIIADTLLSSSTNTIENSNNTPHLQKENNLFCSSSNTVVHSSNPLKSDHNIIDFGKWFFFCQHCRHGGHANCIDEWFGDDNICDSVVIDKSKDLDSLEHSSYHFKSKKRTVCGVNGCLCKCKSKQ